MKALHRSVFALERPNVILIFMDNFGWEELGVYGSSILRGAPTPRIDKLASEGMRLLNFNLEAQVNTGKPVPLPNNLLHRFLYAVGSYCCEPPFLCNRC